MTPLSLAAGQSITVHVTATDAADGVDTNKIIAILLNSQGSGQISITNGWSVTGPNTFSASAVIPAFAVTGTWRVYAIFIYDKAGNGDIFLNGRDYTQYFTVTNPQSDGSPPALTGISVQPTVVPVGSDITVTIGLTDAPAGVDLSALFVHMVPIYGGAGYDVEANTWTAAGNNTYVSTVTIPSGRPVGNWYIDSIFTRDLAGNAIHYHDDQDFNVDFQVIEPFAPNIYKQPYGVKTTTGAQAGFNVLVNGTAPIYYQWLKNGSPIAGANGASYTTPALLPGDNGSLFSVIVSNAYGSEISDTAEVRFGPSDYQTIVSGQAPAYWFRLDTELTNSGTLFAPDLDRYSGLFAPDFQNVADLAFLINDGEESLVQTQDIVSAVGSMSILFRTPDAPITGFRHVFAQGTDTASSNAFNLVFGNPDLTLKFGNATTKPIIGQPLPGTWYFLCFTWDTSRDDNEVRWWLGPLGGSLKSGLLDINNTAVAGDGGPLILGGNEPRGYGNFRENGYPGIFDEPALWTRELTELEIFEQFATTTAEPGAPVVIRQPNAVTTKDGAFAYFDLEAFGNAPLSYQWQRNTIDIPGATGLTAGVGPVTIGSDNGAAFRCIVSNPIGTTTSDVAVLTVTSNRYFQQTLSLQAPDYWFPMDGSLANVGSMYAPSLNATGGAFTNDNVLNPNSAYALIGGQDNLQETQDIIPAAGSMTLLFRAPDTAITGFRHVFGQGVETGSTNAWNLVFANPDLQLKAANASLTLISGQPVPGAWYYFNARWDESRDAGELKWTFAQIGGSLKSGVLDINNTGRIGNDGILFLGNKDPGFGALREVDFPGRVDEAAVWTRELSDLEVIQQFITTTSPLGYPYILTQPMNAAGKDGESVVFSVNVTGQTPLYYQWRSNGTAIAGATGTNLIFGPLSTNDNGLLFDVVITNILGSVTSQTASVTVTPLNDYQQILHNQSPDYWFRLDNSLVNRGALPAPALTTAGGAFTTDIGGNELSAYDIIAANAYLQEANDVISPSGSVSFLFRTPNDPLSGFRHLFAQGVDTVTSNSFNILYNNPNLTLRVGSKTTTMITGTPEAGTWYYFAANWDDTRDAGEVTWYLGIVGESLTSGVLDLGDTDVVGNGGPVTLGNRDNAAGSAWRMPGQPGTVDELAVWVRELSYAEIAAQFQGAFPSLTSIPGSNLVFRSSGTNTVDGGWTLSENGFVGCFVNVLASTSGTRSVTLSANMSGISDGGIFPGGNIRVGGESASFLVNSSAVYQHTFNLPPGMHAVRVELTNAPFGSSRKLSVKSLSGTGNGMTLVNTADDATCLASANTYIENWRKGNVTIQVVDGSGATQQNANVTISLQRHAFRFGVAASGLRSTSEAPPDSQLNWLSGTTSDGNNYRAFVSNNFNSVGFRNGAKWNPQEATRDVVNMVLTDQLLGFAETNGMSVRIHTLGWANDTFAPVWAYTLYTNALAGNASDAAEFRAELSERSQYLIRDRAGRFDEVDIVNEDYHKTGYADIYGTNGLVGIYLEAQTNISLAGGRAKAYVNEFNVLRNQEENGSYLLSYANWYRRHIESLESYSAGQHIIDGIGIQGHVRTDAGARSSSPYSIRRNLQTVLHLSVLGKPVSITEFDVTNDDGSGGPLPDAEATNILMTAMTTFFGTPGMTTFMLWDFWEPAMDPEKTGVALVDASWNLTASGEAYTNRMAEWDVEESLIAGSDGSVTFRGFYGTYCATITAPGGNPTNICFSIEPGSASTSIVLIAEGGSTPTNTYGSVVQSQNPDYWFRFSGNLSNSGSQSAPDLVADNGAFGPDYDGTANRAYQMIGGFDDLSQANDIIASTGSFSFIFRTPDAPLAFRHIFAQGADTASGDAFNLIAANPNLNFRVGNASATVYSGIPPTSTWFYLAATWDDSRDAGEVIWWFGPVGGTLTQGIINMGDANTVGNNSTLFIGNRDAVSSVAFRMPGAPGTIDEFAVWTTELSAGNISNQFAALSVGLGGGSGSGGSLFSILGLDNESRLESSGGLMVMFESKPGHTYKIYWCDALHPEQWQYAASITASANTTAWTDEGDAGSGRSHPFAQDWPRFYRVMESAAP